MITHLKVHYFQHIAAEGLGSCLNYLKQMNAQISTTEFFALPKEQALDIEALPDVSEVDLLIIMGGTLSVNDDVNHPWLKTEKRWLRRYLATGKPAIGLCLGGQLIANALGAAVSRHTQQELGWSTVKKVDAVPADCFQLPEEFEVMQWHSESFEIPKGAIRLAQNEVCLNQAYQLGRNVLGFQFHPEMTAHALDLFLSNSDELALFSGQYVQSIDRLKQSSKDDFIQGNQILNQAIAYVLSRTSWAVVKPSLA